MVKLSKFHWEALLQFSYCWNQLCTKPGCICCFTGALQHIIWNSRTLETLYSSCQTFLCANWDSFFFQIAKLNRWLTLHLMTILGCGVCAEIISKLALNIHLRCWRGLYPCLYCCEGCIFALGASNYSCCVNAHARVWWWRGSYPC